jgi:Tol biopolymer transport system component
VGATYDDQGLPIRVRLSSDGQLGAMTVFVTGHSYSDAAFSTLTNLVDTRAGQITTDLEKFNIEREGAPFRSVDFNFWGVTFARGGDRFYATLGTGGQTYLLEGTVSARTARVIASNVECPSLSPDNTRIAFKQRKSGDTRTWHLAVLDLTSMSVSQVPGEARSIDDQVEWLDDTHILYAAQREGSIATDIWEASIDGSSQPRVFVSGALSPAVVR